MVSTQLRKASCTYFNYSSYTVHGKPFDERNCKKSQFHIGMYIHCTFKNLVMRKLTFCIAKTNVHISFAVNAKLISTFVFATWIEEYYLYLFPKIQASSLFLLPYMPVRNLQRPFVIASWLKCNKYEPPHGKTNNLYRRKQRRRSASR